MRITIDTLPDRTELRCEGHLVTIRHKLDALPVYAVVTGKRTRQATYHKLHSDAFFEAVTRVQRLAAQSTRPGAATADGLLFEVS